MTICLLLFVAIRPQGTTAATSITAVFDSFTTSNTSAFNFVGSAAVDTGLSALSLTPSASGYGAAWWNQRIKLGNNRSFSAHFTFSMSDMVNSPGDGMTFALQTNSNNSGGGGGGLGIEGISPSFAVEFDTFDNAGDDTGSNQIGIDIDGDVTSVWKMNAPVALYGGTLHYAWIDYDGSTDTLDIRLSDSSTRPGTATASVVINSVSGGRHLYDILGENVYVGFTAATGWAHENHYVKSFYFNNDYIAGSITPSTETYTPFPAIVTLTPSLTSIPADGSSTTTLNICAKDSGGNALSGQSIALSTTAGTLSTASVTTGVGGCASATLTSSATPANATVSATAEGGVVKQAQVAFSTTKAVKNAGGAYIQGTYVEIGINNNGYFGAAAPNAPAGFHDNESRFLGFVADYQKDGWTNGTPNFGGDYFTPGTEYEGFGIACTGGSAANYGSAASTITTDSLTVGPGL
ncbi:MAG: Ig-like domain-containing protein, partial [Anaerolineae bacterium]|nr:Ig-like domain-containing protein [Anaerolineae bacterium]